MEALQENLKSNPLEYAAETFFLSEDATQVFDEKNWRVTHSIKAWVIAIGLAHIAIRALVPWRLWSGVPVTTSVKVTRIRRRALKNSVSARNADHNRRGVYGFLLIGG